MQLRQVENCCQNGFQRSRTACQRNITGWLVGVAAMSKIFAVAIQSNFSIMLNLQLFEEFLRTYSQ